MKKENASFEYEVFDSVDSLPAADGLLLEKARAVALKAYAPYSNFFVGAALLLQNGQTVTGTNQENAASPAGLCAERVALSAGASLYPGVPILTIAISYFNNKTNTSLSPLSPCGICRQSLLEYELRQQQPIRVVLGGMEGEIVVISDVKKLLPMYFSGADMA